MRISQQERIAALKAAAATCPHGTRARYEGGCKCLLCRAAKSRYNTQREHARRAGDVRDLVDAGTTRRHLLKLSRLGCGYKTVGDAASVSKTVLQNVMKGRKKRVRASTERAVLAVTVEARADHALIDAGPTWEILNGLIERGYTRTQLAAWLGSKAKTPSIQFKRTLITVQGAASVERLKRQLDAGKLARP